MSKKNTQNGNPNVLTPQQEAMRLEVLDRELRSRFAKANWEIMHYSLEGEKLQEDYKGFIDRERARQDENKAQYEKFIASLQEEANQKSAEVAIGSQEQPEVVSAEAEA